MKGWLIIVIVFLLVAAGGYLIWLNSRPNENLKSLMPDGTSGSAALNGFNQTKIIKSEEPQTQTAESRLLKTYQFPGILPQSAIQNKAAVIITAKGEIKFEILADDGPKAASNFVYLAKEGYYDGLKFHRVELWVIQGGDPNCGSTRAIDSGPANSPPIAAGRCGAGGPGYKFEDEPVKLEYKKGIVAMANAGPDTNGSQFFILKRDTPLQPNYTIFGRMISGMDVVEKIAAGDIIAKVTIADK